MFFEEGKCITEISRQTGYDRKTIRMYIKKDDWNEKKPKALPEAQFPKLTPFKETIDEWLTEDKKAKRKQRHTARRVYNRLVEKHACLSLNLTDFFTCYSNFFGRSFFEHKGTVLLC